MRRRSTQWREVRRAAVTTAVAAAVFAGAFGFCIHQGFAPPRQTFVTVYAENPCDEPRYAVFHYDDSTTWAAGGNENVGFDVAAGSRSGPQQIGTPGLSGLLLLEVYRSSNPDDEQPRLAAHSYNGALPTESVDGKPALVLKVPQTACGG